MPEFTTYAPGTPNWVDVTWADLDAAADFYGALFGWSRTALPAEAGGYAMFELGGKVVAGLQPKMAPEHPSFWATFIAVADVEASAATVVAEGGALLAGPMDVMGSGKLAVFTAPDGSTAALWEPGTHQGSALANEPGAFTWNELNSRDEAKSKAFYTALFGWEVESTEMMGSTYTMFNQNGGPVAGMTAMPEMVPAQAPSYWLVYFGVANVDDTVALATSKGAQVLAGPMDTPAGRLAVLVDPEKAPFALVQIPEQP